MFKKRKQQSVGALRQKTEALTDGCGEKEEEEEEESILPKKVAATTGSNKNAGGENEIVSTTAVFESSRVLMPQTYAGDATYTSEIDTATDRDARAILERSIALNNDGTLDSEPNVYRGQAAYKSFVRKDMAQVGANKVTGTQGPIRAPSFVRSTCRFDYQPDVCKDYKETGFCGYGDNCKFMHDRGDYKSGWQLEKEWDQQQAKKKKKLEESIKKFEDDERGGDEGGGGEGGGNGDDEEEDYEIKDGDDLPFACHICRGDFVNPIVTLCGHYFCSKCALEANKKSPKCAICDKQTFAVFNRATKLVKKLQTLKKT